jgi:hypothetical protein
MRGRARPVHYARMRVSSVTRTVTYSAQEKWAPHLQLANKILEEEGKLSAPLARRIIAKSVTCALVCAQAMDNRALALSRCQSKTKVTKSFARLANCLARAPARLRHRLDQRVRAILQEPFNSESIEALIDATYRAFTLLKVDPAPTALRALSAVRWQNKKLIGLKANYSALDPAIHRKCETAIASVPDSAPGTAMAVLNALAGAIKDATSTGVPRDSSDLIRDYVSSVAVLWRDNGLSAGRAYHYDNRQYRSRFHRFVELVLTAVTEPGSNRHTADLDEIRRQIYKNLARFPLEVRANVDKGPRREDREWLVSEDHIRKALKALGSTTLKTGRQTPYD